MRKGKTQLTILLAGQPETGRTTTARNLFAAMADDPGFQPQDVAGRTWAEFAESTAPFTTSVTCQDDSQPLEVTYNIIVCSPALLPDARPQPPRSRSHVARQGEQRVHRARVVQETPGLTRDDDGVLTLCNCITSRQAAFSAQEVETARERGEIKDERIDVVLFFLPTNARVSASDVSAMTFLGALVPLVPVMCKVRGMALIHMPPRCRC